MSSGRLIGPVAIDPKEQALFDAPLMALAQKSGGDLRILLSAFFSFLDRKTDFYFVPHPDDPHESIKMGFREGDAEKLLLASYRQHPLRRMPKGVSSGMKGATDPVVKNKNDDKSKASETASKKEEVTKTPAVVVEKQSAEKSNNATKKSDTAKHEIRLTDEGKQIPVGNGGCSTKREDLTYHWTQTIDEATLVLPVPEKTRGRDLSVDICTSSVSIIWKQSKKVILEGELAAKVRKDESTWSLEGGALVITFDKLQKTWWDHVVGGDEVIDTSLIDSKRKVSDYDDATQGAIRKIIFDQQQQQLGLPTSDEILGVKPQIPPLPKGVEYIDADTLKQPKVSK